MKVLILDNYDSFTYNIVQIVEELNCCQLSVYKNDAISINEINHFDKIIISPGPGLPSDVKLLDEMIQKYGSQKSILGVCLGHQALAVSFGAKLFQLPKIFHGVATKTYIVDNQSILFQNIENPFLAGRYHSWAIEENTLPKSLIITAKTDDNIIMGIRHREYDLHGIQFHPESIMTPFGKQMIYNWLQNKTSRFSD